MRWIFIYFRKEIFILYIWYFSSDAHGALFLCLPLAERLLHFLEGVWQKQAFQGTVQRGRVLHRAAAFQHYGRARGALQESPHFYQWARRQALPCQTPAVTFQPKMSLENLNRPHSEPSLLTPWWSVLSSKWATACQRKQPGSDIIPSRWHFLFTTSYILSLLCHCLVRNQVFREIISGTHFLFLKFRFRFKTDLNRLKFTRSSLFFNNIIWWYNREFYMTVCIRGATGLSLHSVKKNRFMTHRCWLPPAGHTLSHTRRAAWTHTREVCLRWDECQTLNQMCHTLIKCNTLHIIPTPKRVVLYPYGYLV